MMKLKEEMKKGKRPDDETKKRRQTEKGKGKLIAN
jgi:hypothetical protein